MNQETLDIALARAVAGEILHLRIAAKAGDPGEAKRRQSLLNEAIDHYIKHTKPQNPFDK